MFATLFQKELMGHVLSVRFHLSALLVVVLMAGGGLVFRTELVRRAADFAAAEEARHDELARRSGYQAPLFQLFSYYDQPVMARPSRLGFIAEGHERDLPNAVLVNAFRLRGPTSQQRGNAMLPAFQALDWVLIVSVVLSFAALVLTFDAFAGEREDGTLRLVLSNPVPRWMLVAAKAAGAWAVIAIALLMGSLVQLLILVPGSLLPLDGATVLRVGGALVLSLLYVAGWVLFGLLVSARHSSAASALVVGLLVWAALVVIVPRSTVLLAHALQPVASRDLVEREASAELEAIRTEYLRAHPKKENEWFSGHWSPAESLQLAVEMWGAYERRIDLWRDAQIRQVELARRASFVSPAAVLAAGLERVSGGGLESHRAFLGSLRRYRAALSERLQALYPVDPVDAPGLDDALTRKVVAVDVSAADLPPLAQERRSTRAALASAAPFAGALAIIDLLLLLAAAVAATRYDVR